MFSKIKKRINFLRPVIRPFYYYVKDSPLFPYSKKLMNRNSMLKNKFVGRRCFALLTGESLNCIDISKLKGEYTAGIGFLFLDKNIIDLPLSFFMNCEVGKAMDKAPGSINWPEKIIPSGGKNQGFIFLKKMKEHFIDNGTVTFLNANKISYYKKTGFFHFGEPNVFYIKSNPNFFSAKDPSLDITKRFDGGEGGVFNLILLLIYMGFKEIFLVGAGYTYEPVYLLHYYDNPVYPKDLGREKAEIEARKYIEVRNQEADIVLEYYGLLEKRDHYRMICVQRKSHTNHKNQHEILNNFAKTQGVKIHNIVPEGFESPIYEKISWTEVEKKLATYKRV